MRGSVLGIGTDIAGSIRIPAICNGTFALRPSADRIPYGGQTSSGRGGKTGIRACAGPLATSVRDLNLFMKLVSDFDPWQFDSSVIYSPWRAVTSKSGSLRLGLIEEDPHFPLHPPVLRTLQQATEKLQAAGHEIVPLVTPSIKDACALSFRMFAMDPAGTASRHIAASGEPTIPALASTSLPHEYMQYDYAPLTLEGLYDLNEQRNKFKEEFRSLVVRAGIDAIIMPGYQGTAQPHDVFGFVPYTVLWNLLDVSGWKAALKTQYSCLHSTRRASYHLAKQTRLPIQRSFAMWTTDLLVCIMSSNTWVEYSSGRLRLTTHFRSADTAEAVEGAPCCVQLVGRNMREEELIQITQVVADVLAG